MSTKASDKSLAQKNKLTEKKLSKTMENLNSELASSLSTIVRQVRGIQMEHAKNSTETDSAYMRRRPSHDNSNNFDNFHLHPDPARFRSKSFGQAELRRPKTTGKLKHLSPDHEKPHIGGKSILKPKKSGERTPIQSSPNDREHPVQADDLKSGQRNRRVSIDLQNSSPLTGGSALSAVPRNRRMSLPAIMLSAEEFQNDTEIRASARANVIGQNAGNTNHRETSPEGTTLQLKRLQRELNQRKPKSSRELKHYQLTTADEKRELAKIQGDITQEIYFGESDVDYQQKLYRELSNCSYLRRPSVDSGDFSVEDVLK